MITAETRPRQCAATGVLDCLPGTRQEHGRPVNATATGGRRIGRSARTGSHIPIASVGIPIRRYAGALITGKVFAMPLALKPGTHLSVDRIGFQVAVRIATVVAALSEGRLLCRQPHV